jgi:hypothetical protein
MANGHIFRCYSNSEWVFDRQNKVWFSSAKTHSNSEQVKFCTLIFFAKPVRCLYVTLDYKVGICIQGSKYNILTTDVCGIRVVSISQSETFLAIYLIENKTLFGNFQILIRIIKLQRQMKKYE